MKNKINLESVIYELKNNGFNQSRLISGSKSMYRNNHYENLVAFNANIFTEEFGKIWHGDLDLAKDANLLKTISNITGVTLYVLSEMDGRFDNENRTDFKLAAIWDTNNGLCDSLKLLYSNETLKLLKYKNYE